MAGVDYPILPAEPGTYAIVCENPSPTVLRVGHLGRFALGAGRYIYVGSAHGPGGIRARVTRHLRREKRPHWHIDYLTAALPVVYVVSVPGCNPMECAWVSRLHAQPGVSVPILRFGSGDCREGCRAHLVWLPDEFELERLDELLR
jgi:Uri superfamily endonuclease